MPDLPPKRDTGAILSSRDLTLRLARNRHIDGMLIKNSDSTFEQRATARQGAELAVRQRNLETIMVMASRHCGESAAGGEPDPDWLTRFLQLAEEIASPPMQQLWGRIMALEVAVPGSISVRALATLKEMTQRDAQLFQRLCALVCTYAESDDRRLLTGLHRGSTLFNRPRTTHLGLGKYRLPYNALLQLFELGLLYKGELESGDLPAEGLELAFANQRWRLRARHPHSKLLYYRLTPVGNELAQLIDEPAHKEYQSDLGVLLAQGLSVEVTQTAAPEDEKGG